MNLEKLKIIEEHFFEIYPKVVEHGGSISTQIFNFPGGRRFHFLDVNGNEFAVWSEV